MLLQELQHNGWLLVCLCEYGGGCLLRHLESDQSSALIRRIGIQYSTPSRDRLVTLRSCKVASDPYPGHRSADNSSRCC